MTVLDMKRLLHRIHPMSLPLRSSLYPPSILWGSLRPTPGNHHCIKTASSLSSLVPLFLPPSSSLSSLSSLNARYIYECEHILIFVCTNMSSSESVLSTSIAEMISEEGDIYQATSCRKESKEVHIYPNVSTYTLTV